MPQTIVAEAAPGHSAKPVHLIHFSHLQQSLYSTSTDSPEMMPLLSGGSILFGDFAHSCIGANIRCTSSYVTVRHSLSTRMLSEHRPFPSMLILTPPVLQDLGERPTRELASPCLRRGRLWSVLNNVGNQQKWDHAGPERSRVGRRSRKLPLGPVVLSAPFDGLGLHLLVSWFWCASIGWIGVRQTATSQVMEGRQKARVAAPLPNRARTVAWANRARILQGRASNSQDVLWNRKRPT